MVNEPTALPYLKALMPCAEDHIVVNTSKADKTTANEQEKTTNELQDNPYQKPAKKLKTELT